MDNLFQHILWVYSCVTLLPMLIGRACKLSSGGLVNIVRDHHISAWAVSSNSKFLHFSQWFCTFSSMLSCGVQWRGTRNIERSSEEWHQCTFNILASVEGTSKCREIDNLHTRIWNFCFLIQWSRYLCERSIFVHSSCDCSSSQQKGGLPLLNEINGS